MSAEATGWVYRCSPVTGAAFAVHLACADSANDQHGYELWMTAQTIATKARVSRRAVGAAVAALTEAGCLVLLESGKNAGRANRYRLLMPDLIPVYDPQQGYAQGADPNPGRVGTGCVPGRHDVPRGSAPGAEETQGEPKGNPKKEPSGPAGPASLLPAEPIAANEWESFEAFWTAYPKRAGKRVGKAASLALWRKLTTAERAAVMQALPNYAAGCNGYPRDPERFLRTRLWTDWQEPAEPTVAAPSQRRGAFAPPTPDRAVQAHERF